MLREHLSQQHDAASRRFATIDAQADWIQRQVLKGHPTTILDLGCGPGFYASRLARLGHRCVGIDYSPTSIRYAEEHSSSDGLNCEFRCEDIRNAEFGGGFGLVMLIFGELNVFRPDDAKSILRKARKALAGGGVLLIEPHTFSAVQAMATRPRNWYATSSGLFCDRPHVFLQEQHWDASANTATRRYFVVDAETANVTMYAQTLQAYTDDDYRDLLRDCGFADAEFHPTLTGALDDADSGLCVILARAK